MNPLRLWKLLFVSLLAFLVVACKPYASFTVSPDPVVAAQAATFDASGSAVWTSPRNNTVVSYAWDFGDGATATGKIATHTFATAGSYRVKLSVTDRAGRVGTTTVRVVVEGAVSPPDTVPLKVTVQGLDGALLADATVKLGSRSFSTNPEGVATIPDAPVGNALAVLASKTGFVSQGARLSLVAGSTANDIVLRLLPVKQTLAIAQAQDAQTLLASSLGAQVTLPENALANAGGTVATGPITVQLTPWSIRNGDLAAMLGGGRALDSDGSTVVDLISAGMITVDFFDASGNKLQLAAGKTADIQMHLLATRINGQDLVVGSVIPLWTFDETLGLWTQEGTGEVVEDFTSPTGLAVKATVSHFSTWNWDFKIERSGTVQLSCVDESGALSACTVLAEITLPDGSIQTRNTYIGPEVVTVINMPTDATIRWNGANALGQRGQTTSTTQGTVVIELSPPTTSHFVRCRLPDDSPVACQVTLTGTPTTGAQEVLTWFVPASGATVKSTFDPAAALTWTGRSVRVGPNGATIINTGGATSGPSGTVLIDLDTEEVITGKVLRLACAASAGPEVVPSQTLNECTIGYTVFRRDESTIFAGQVTVPVGEEVVVTLPPESGISAQATAVSVPNGFNLSDGLFLEDLQFNSGDLFIFDDFFAFQQPS